jgi:hypothetical protein
MATTSATAHAGNNANAVYAGHARPDSAQTPIQATIVTSPSTPETPAIAQLSADTLS